MLPSSVSKPNGMQALKSSASGRIAFTAEHAEALDEELTDALVDHINWRRRWNQLLDVLPPVDAAVYSEQESPAAHAVRTAISNLFLLSCSQSGTEVRVRGNASADVGVLILGYGGASMKLLAPVDAVYGKVQPRWRVVTTTQSGLTSEKAQALAQAQLAETAAALSGCRHIVVHALSNNGWYAWLRICRHDPTLGERLIGCVFDCAGLGTDGGTIDDERAYQVLSKTTSGVMVLADLTPPDEGLQKATRRLEAASRLMATSEEGKWLLSGGARQLGGDESNGGNGGLLRWQCQHERPVPTLCLTSSTDLVVPETSVRAFADAIRAAQPSRHVRVACLEGVHCQLQSSDRAAYEGAVAELSKLAAAEANKRPLTGPSIEFDFVPSITSGTMDISEPAPPPAAAPSAAAGGPVSLTSILEAAGLDDALAGGLAEQLTLEDALEALATGRPALLGKLKAAGVAKLPERQSIANALGKHARAMKG